MRHSLAFPPFGPRHVCRSSAVATLILLALAACTPSQSVINAAGAITVEALRDSILANAGLMLVDVRTASECRVARAPEVRKFIPYEEITARHAELGIDWDTPVYVICHSGRRSGIAADALTRLGYTRACNVIGGTLAWQKAGFPVHSGPLTKSGN